MGETTIRGIGAARDSLLSALRSATRGAGLRLDGPAWSPNQSGIPCDETLPEVMSTGAFCRRLSSCLRRVAQEEALDEGRVRSRRQEGPREGGSGASRAAGPGSAGCTGPAAAAAAEGAPCTGSPLCTLLTSASVRRAFGGDVEGRMHEYFVRARVSAWLGEQEERSRFVVLQTDEACTPWTQLCVRQADVVLLVGDGTFGARGARSRRHPMLTMLRPTPRWPRWPLHVGCRVPSRVLDDQADPGAREARGSRAASRPRRRWHQRQRSPWWIGRGSAGERDASAVRCTPARAPRCCARPMTPRP